VSGIALQMNVGFDDAIEIVTRALESEGFGVVTRIDLDETFQKKLGVSFRRYTILGACNPGLAHEAVSAEPSVGLLLPCNVTVEAAESGVVVRLADAKQMMAGAGFGDSEAIRNLAADADARLSRVVAALAMKRGSG